jgi:hypothetical protein
MQDPRDGQIQYLIHFSDGGSGMRWQEQPLEAGAALRDGGSVYAVERVEPPPNPMGFGHVWAVRIE